LPSFHHAIKNKQPNGDKAPGNQTPATAVRQAVPKKQNEINRAAVGLRVLILAFTEPLSCRLEIAETNVNHESPGINANCFD
jgi:hypothetical protein